MRLPRVLAAALWLTALGSEARAQAPPDDDAFVREVIEVVNSGDVERRRRIIHPAARACTEAAGREPLEGAVRRQAAAPIGDNHRSTIRPLNAAQPLLFSDTLDWIPRPTHTLQITYQADARRRRTLTLPIATAAGRWYEVVPCPKPGVLPAPVPPTR